MISREEYQEMIIDHLSGEPASYDSSVTEILFAHVIALQERIDKLIDPDVHDAIHTRGCLCYHVTCACAYDYPTAVCFVHNKSSAPPRN